jgi:hypothetical protein
VQSNVAGGHYLQVPELHAMVGCPAVASCSTCEHAPCSASLATDHERFDTRTMRTRSLAPCRCEQATQLLARLSTCCPTGRSFPRKFRFRRTRTGNGTQPASPTRRCGSPSKPITYTLEPMMDPKFIIRGETLAWKLEIQNEKSHMGPFTEPIDHRSSSGKCT